MAAFGKDKKLKYEIDRMNERDIQAQREYAVRKGREEGLEQGLEQGREQGREQARISIARKFFEAGTPIDVIVECTGVDKATVESFAVADK